MQPSGNKPVSIGLVIPSYNDRPFLERLFESLYTKRAGAGFLPLVVDDCSTDNTAEFLNNDLRGYATILRSRQRAYFTEACNAGINYWVGNHQPAFIFLLNSDTEVTDDWASALIATSRKFNAGIVGATLLNPNGTVQHAGAYGMGYHYGINKPWRRFHRDRIVPWVTGAAMAIRLDTVDKAGYLPPGKVVGQYDESDRNYCVTARMHGNVEIAVSAGCVIYHHTIKVEALRRNRGDY